MALTAALGRAPHHAPGSTRRVRVQLTAGGRYGGVGILPGAHRGRTSGRQMPGGALTGLLGDFGGGSLGRGASCRRCAVERIFALYANRASTSAGSLRASADRAEHQYSAAA
ncbi:hypothetical protein J7I94_28745 [Streptomyces sp. ISL-12]|uniref:hypothetical protein n=1 Tax=Streptomyces sp. ISL-12 TaxID=2819177 RepID=UPI001BEB13DA|nr:hypothetical protein [Streptomyces sp. ISL-12]MBT2414487.1 hypothetical protein [Streptomyces sp. ISL-12]